MSALPSNVDWRLRDLERRSSTFEDALHSERDRVTRHEEQISGESGLLALMHELKEEMSSVRKALYAAAGGAVFAAISIAIAIAVYG